MILPKSKVAKILLTSFLIVIVLITLILAESPDLKNFDFKSLSNNSRKLVPNLSKQINSTGAESKVTTLQKNAVHQFESNQSSTLTSLPGQNLSSLNSAEQQLSPYQLRNASPQQLQKLRQMQDMQQLQRQRSGIGLSDLIGAFIPGTSGLLGNTRNNPANTYSNINGSNRGNNGNNPSTIAQLLGLTPQQPNNGGSLSALGLNLYPNNNQNNMMNQQQQQQNPRNSYGQTNANLKSLNENSSNDSVDTNDNSDVDKSENSAEDNSGQNDDESDQANQEDPSQDPDIQQFNNLQGNENFPGDLFPAGILSENDLKDIQKSMEEQAKKEEEKQKQQEDADANDSGEEGDSENDQGNTEEGDQSSDDQSPNDANANQTESNQDNSNRNTNSEDESEANKGELNTNKEIEKSNFNYIPNNNVGSIDTTRLNNMSKKKLSGNRPMSGYSYNSLRPSNYRNRNSNVQYENDEQLAKNDYDQSNRPRMTNNLIPNRNYIDERIAYGQNDLYRLNRPNNFGDSRINDYQGRNRIDDLYANNYRSKVDYSPEFNQEGINNSDQFNQDPDSYNIAPEYNPIRNYRPKESLSRHLNRQHNNIDNFNNIQDNNIRNRDYVNELGGDFVNDRARLRNYLDARTRFENNPNTRD